MGSTVTPNGRAHSVPVSNLSWSASKTSCFHVAFPKSLKWYVNWTDTFIGSSCNGEAILVLNKSRRPVKNWQCCGPFFKWIISKLVRILDPSYTPRNNFCHFSLIWIKSGIVQRVFAAAIVIELSSNLIWLSEVMPELPTGLRSMNSPNPYHKAIELPQLVSVLVRKPKS